MFTNNVFLWNTNANLFFTVFIIGMNVTNNISTYNYSNHVNSPAFGKGGKPITLQYVIEKRSYLLPERVRTIVNELLKQSNVELPSLIEVHKIAYAPLMACKTLDDAKKLFPEFEKVKDEVEFVRDTVYSKNFKSKTDDKFSLDMLKKFWAELKTKDDIAYDLHMKGRNSLDWALKNINFVSFPSNYKTLLKASDEVGNREITSKTKKWNAEHPELVKKHNKIAAQGCKTPEYRETQSKRMITYDKQNPQRREKISKYAKRVWELCPDVKAAMANFAKTESAYLRGLITKKCRGELLTDTEAKYMQAFFKRFWRAYPECRNSYAKARAIASMEIRAGKLLD